ncbi:glycosyl hydrolase [Kutzneria albida]|uniref:GH26 domain-containing protein n=1 Tax=Kutzneria albida DSM 43870 TaxID=1449976 RepID=W5WBP2_9PSEU|nr:glycosyl hydrolase [Kutzneria albida]AHH98297.1 hypothetical protein KALB_4935 [Kutzneria albida DSM 43870]
MKAADVVPYLTAIRGNAWLAGQQLPSDDRTPTAAQLLDIAKPPAILGVNIPVGDNDSSSIALNPGAQKIATTHAQQGGLIAACMHMPNLWGSDQSIGSAWVANTNTAKPDLTSVLSGTSTARARYLRVAQRVIDYIHALPSDAPVIFRPFHEAGGSWFVWGRDNTNPARSEAGVKALWTDLMGRVIGACPNVIPAWSGAMSWYSPILYGLTPDAQVVGASLYLPDPTKVTFANSGDYTALVGTGKPALLFEFGPSSNADTTPAYWDTRILRDALAKTYPKLVGAIAWFDNNSWLRMANSPQVFADPRCVTRDRLPATAPQPVSYVYGPSDPGIKLRSAPTADAPVKIPVWGAGQ